jgi:hypothetical protein
MRAAIEGPAILDAAGIDPDGTETPPMRKYWSCLLITVVCWASAGCDRSELGPPKASPTTDPGGEAFSKPTKRTPPAAAPKAP